MTNFSIRILVERARWPFPWGPFGGPRWVSLHCESALLEISQRGSDPENPIKVECHAGRSDLTTTVDFRGGSRLKRRTTP